MISPWPKPHRPLPNPKPRPRPLETIPPQRGEWWTQ